LAPHAEIAQTTNSADTVCRVSIEFPAGTRFDKIFSAQLNFHTAHPFYTQLVEWEMRSGIPSEIPPHNSGAPKHGPQGVLCPATELDDLSCGDTPGGSVVRGTIAPRAGEILRGNLSVTSISMLSQILKCGLNDSNANPISIMSYSQVVCDACAKPSHRKLTPFSTYADRVPVSVWAGGTAGVGADPNNLTVTFFVEKNALFQRTQFRKALAMGQIVFSLFIILLALRTYHLYAVGIYEVLRRNVARLAQKKCTRCFVWSQQCTCLDFDRADDVAHSRQELPLLSDIGAPIHSSDDDGFDDPKRE
jgi:hypothetical protein